MKTLIIQLARLGDIYQMWPSLRAIKRHDPEGELHVLSRRKFREALNGIDVVDQFWQLDSRLILEPAFESCGAALVKLEELCYILRGQGFDRVINLSFSPVSSFLTHAITMQRSNAKMVCDVRGYTRTDDGYLKIPDDASAYFYAQVGPGRANRLHLSDLFAHIAGVELSHNDWRPPLVEKDSIRHLGIKPGAVLVHIGASQKDKTLSWTKWASVVAGLVAAVPNQVILIGALGEHSLAVKIATGAGTHQPVNLVGQTTLTQLFALLSTANLLIGGDSGPVHMASLCGTPVLNFSLPEVNFWETGPKSAGSRIICMDDESEFASDSLVHEAVSMLNLQGTRPDQVNENARWARCLPTIDVAASTKAYFNGPIVKISACPFIRDQFRAQLVRALYLGDEFPESACADFLNGVSKLADINALVLEQIEVLVPAPAVISSADSDDDVRKNGKRKTASLILERADEIIEQIALLVPNLAPLIGWFQTERLRIAPMPVAELTAATRAIHLKLADILSLYGGEKAGRRTSEGNHDNDDTLLG